MGEGIKFTDKLRPFPLTPPMLNMDPVEYGEFVLPEVKVFTPEEITAHVEGCFEELWGKLEADEEGVSKDDFKAMAGEMKGRLYEKGEPMEINEEAFDAMCQELDEKIKKDEAQVLLG